MLVGISSYKKDLTLYLEMTRIEESRIPLILPPPYRFGHSRDFNLSPPHDHFMHEAMPTDQYT